MPKQDTRIGRVLNQKDQISVIGFPIVVVLSTANVVPAHAIHNLQTRQVGMTI